MSDSLNHARQPVDYEITPTVGQWACIVAASSVALIGFGYLLAATQFRPLLPVVEGAIWLHSQLGGVV